MVNPAHVRDALTSVLDPELGYNIVDLGLVYDIRVSEAGDVDILLTLTSPACPAGDTIQADMKKAVEVLEGVHAVHITITFIPPWDPSKASEDLKQEFILMGILPASS